MTKRSRITAAVVALIGAGALMLSAQTVFAAITWGGAWSAEKPQGTPATCSGGWLGEYTGGSELNGNDLGQVLGWCWTGTQYWCGGTAGWTYHVRARGRDVSTNITETTAGSWGPSVFSTAGGRSHEFHQCQKGYEAQ